MFYNRARPSFNNDNNNNVTRGNSVFRSSYPCSVTMAANISDIDVITDVEGIDIPECAHGILCCDLSIMIYILLSEAKILTNTCIVIKKCSIPVL